jgi:hypothetical protein
MTKIPMAIVSPARGHGILGFTCGIMVHALFVSAMIAWIQPDGDTASQRTRIAPLVFNEPRIYTNKELVGMSFGTARKDRLAPTTPGVTHVCSPEKAMKNVNRLGNGMYPYI